MVQAPKIFGLPNKDAPISVEMAYQQLHQASQEAKILYREVYNVDDKTPISNDMLIQDIFPKMEELQMSLSPEDWAELNDIQGNFSDMHQLLKKAVDDGKISESVLEAMLGPHGAGYDLADTYQAMIDEGHTPEGLPIDPATGKEEEVPMYVGQDGKERERSYHRPTKMWWDLATLDDMRNRKDGTLGLYISNPKDLPNMAGLKIGITD